MTGIADPSFLSPEEIPFGSPAELRYAAKQHASQTVAAATHHGVTLTEDSIAQLVALASSKGSIPTAKVRIGDSTVIEVVDSEHFAASMESFLGDVAAGQVSLPDEAAPGWAGSTPLRRVGRGIGKLARRMVPDGVVRASPERMVELAATGPFPAAQRPGEFGGLLRLVRERAPQVLLEIGTNYGGTTALLPRFAPPDALIVTCDIECKVDALQLERVGRRGQRIQFLHVDSHSESGARAIRAAVPAGVDLLFIDGDHSYEGVRQDFLVFADLLRPGGLLVFHDIVEDYRTRFGIATNAYVGGVPRFWRELREAVPSSFAHRELVESRDQDGLGIGVLMCPSAPSPGRVLAEEYVRHLQAPPAPSDEGGVGDPVQGAPQSPPSLPM
jgi:predicted O-methyltransferase YrrM